MGSYFWQCLDHDMVCFLDTSWLDGEVSVCRNSVKADIKINYV
jgi:hypothetical protein